MKLEALGLVWEKPDAWEMRFALAESYFKEHGNLRVPARYKAEGVCLNKWLNEQRQIYLGKRKGKTLRTDQICRLQAIGMDFGAAQEAKQPIPLLANDHAAGLLPLTEWKNAGQDSFAMP